MHTAQLPTPDSPKTHEAPRPNPSHHREASVSSLSRHADGRPAAHGHGYTKGSGSVGVCTQRAVSKRQRQQLLCAQSITRALRLQPARLRAKAPQARDTPWPSFLYHAFGGGGYFVESARQIARQHTKRKTLLFHADLSSVLAPGGGAKRGRASKTHGATKVTHLCRLDHKVRGLSRRRCGRASRDWLLG